jgi:hypothetical protein
MNLWSAPPCCFYMTVLLFVVFHVGRGMIGQTYRVADNPFNPTSCNSTGKRMARWQAIWLLYVHDILLHVCCTVFGFLCLLLAYRLAHNGSELSAALVFLALVGLAGITGQLAVMLSLGKFPSS